MMRPTGRAPCERATFAAVMTDMKDRHALRPGTFQEYCDPRNHRISLMRLKRRHEQAFLNVYEEQCSRHEISLRSARLRTHSEI